MTRFFTEKGLPKKKTGLIFLYHFLWVIRCTGDPIISLKEKKSDFHDMSP